MFRLAPTALAGLMLLCVVPSAAAKPAIAIIKSREIPPYNVAIEGFNKALKDKGVAVAVTVYDMEGNKDTGIKKVKEAIDTKPALILTVGTLATESTKENTRDIPVIFCMVLNPVADGLVKTMEASGNNLTGASMDIPSKKQFEILKTVMPNMKSIGVLFNPQETGALIEEAAASANAVGLKFVKKSVNTESDVPRALEEIGKDVDCLWSVSDSVVFNSFKSIQFTILFTLRNKIPFIGLSSAFVKSGALVAISCDIEDNGYQAGELAARVLSGEKPGAITVATPRKTYLSLNTRIADQIGVKLPQDVVSAAKEIFK